MSRAAAVFCNDRFAGTLTHEDDGSYTFAYDTAYLDDPRTEPVSLTLPKRTEPYRSPVLFPFFFGLLAEGEQKELQLRTLGAPENEHFARLVYSANETIGAVTVRREEDS